MSISKKLRARAANLAVGGRTGRPGFFIRYDYADGVDGSILHYDDVETLLASRKSDFLQTVSQFSNTLPDLWSAVEDSSIPWEPESWFPPLDVIAAYHLVRTVCPKRIVEIGSGISTHVLSRALSDNQSGELVCIDPYPRRSIEDTNAKVERRLLDLKDVQLAEELEKNDILFIDSSHLMLPGTDVDIQFNVSGS